MAEYQSLRKIMDLPSIRRVLDQEAVQISQINLNDQTVEGMRHKKLPIFSVQYHPEASPGPHDADMLFEEFRQLILNWKKAN